MGLPTAKTTVETGTTPLPQLLAERKSVRWDEEEEEQGEAGKPRWGQELAGSCQGVDPRRCRTWTQ